MIELLISKIHTVLIDEQDLKLVKLYKWHVTKTPRKYAVTLSPTQLFMHRLLLQPPKHLWIDHINGNGLDNRRKNLRMCTPQQNCMNNDGWKKAKKYDPCPYKGVWKVAKVTGNHGGKPFEARISILGQQKYIGSFKTAEEAARAYDSYARIHHGRFARYNFPELGENGLRRFDAN